MGNPRLPLLLASLAFLLVFTAAPLTHLDFLARMPGDIGDARLNNYFLENIYQFLKGRSPSLVQLGFFYPFPYVLGFSDNLFGSFPTYGLARLAGLAPDSAFQLWYLLGYLANYLASYFVFRRLGGGVWGSITGALIFTFALPVAAKAGHAQLHYRFAVPLAALHFGWFLQHKNWRALLWAAVWLTWQFYCSIYLGFFLGMLLLAMLLWHAGHGRLHAASSPPSPSSTWRGYWHARSRREMATIIGTLMVLVGLMALLFWPYVQVSSLYGAKRSLSEIGGMLPRPQSYLLADHSHLWSSRSSLFDALPMRQEQQLFVGGVPLLLAVLGAVIAFRHDRRALTVTFAGALLLLLLATLSIYGRSLWFWVAELPLASAIRAVSRIELVLLFPLAALAAVAADALARHKAWRFALPLLWALMVIEFSALSPPVSNKAEWRERIRYKQSLVPTALGKDAILFYAQQSDVFFAEEIDAMWIGLERGLPTLNGYSGFVPPGEELIFGKRCIEGPRRVLAYLDWSGRLDETRYLQAMRRVVPIGFEDCRPEWWQRMPLLSSAPSSYPAEVFKRLAVASVTASAAGKTPIATATLVNRNDFALAAKSRANTPIRLSWRFADRQGRPLSGWDDRVDLPFDVPANGNLDVELPVDWSGMPAAGSLQVSIVQEGLFWAHDLGVMPASATLAELGIDRVEP